MTPSYRNLAIFSGLLLALGPLAHGATIVSSLTSTPGSNITRINVVSWAGMEFATDAMDYSFESATLRMGSSSLVNTASDIEVVVYGDNAGVPGSVIYTLSGPASPISGDFVYAAPFGATLDANTSYHLVARVSSGAGEYAWPNVSFGGGFVATGPGSIANVSESSTNTGANWGESPGSGLLFSIEGTAVPEPSAPALFGLLALMGLVRRRR